MNETNATQDQGTQATPSTQLASDANGEATVAKLYATRAEAESNKPTDASKSLRAFEVLHNGTSKGWVLARGHANAIEQAARLDGYTATTGGSTAVSKEAAAAKVMEMSDDEWKALVAARKAAARGK
jgi:hypothetical protein